jgi:hypothetical protein
MALISMAEWIDRHGLDGEKDLAPAPEPLPALAEGPLHLVPTCTVRWRRHHEPLHATLRPRLHRRGLRLARLRRARAATVRA